MKRYLITLATELDGHSASESYYLETTGDLMKTQMLNILFEPAKKDNEFTIEHEHGNNIYGTAYGDAFALKWVELKDFKTNKIYYLSSRTG